MNSGNPHQRHEADGNPEPSRRYTAGRCRDYLSASVALNDRQERPAPHRGEEIVHSLRKRRGRVNPLVLGSSPSGPTNPSSTHVFACRQLVRKTFRISVLPPCGSQPRKFRMPPLRRKPSACSTAAACIWRSRRPGAVGGVSSIASPARRSGFRSACTRTSD